MKKPHLLLIRLSALGDVAMTVPVLRCLFKTYPHLSITLVSRPQVAPIFGEFENLHFFPVDLNGRHQGIKGIWTLFQELKNLPITAVADLHSVLRTHLLTLLFNLSLFKVSQIDKGRFEKRALTRAQNKRFIPLTHTVYRYSDVFRKLGFPIQMEHHEFPEKPPLPQGILSLFGDSQKKWIGIAPFAAHSGKRYPLDLMQKVIHFLQKDHQIFLFGAGQKEQEQLQVWENAFTAVYNTVGKIDFSEQLDLMGSLDLMISMDSANGHMAANFGIPVLTLWGMTHPFCGFSPFHQSKDHCLTLDRTKFPLIPTSVYGHKIPQGYEKAFRTLQPIKVIEKALEMLKQ
jgi:ADP-heptose:LPS heptosyltransferase